MASLLAFRSWIYATFLIAIFLWTMPPARADDFPPRVPECHGRDLLADLKSKDPQAYERWVTAARQVPNSEAILWRIDGNGLAEPSWLFGTIHVSDPRILNIPVAVQEVFFKSRTLAVEIRDLGNRWADFFNSLFALPQLYLPDGKTWDQYLTRSELDFMETELQAYGYTVSALQRTQPWATMLNILFYPSCETWRIYLGKNYLDAELANWARQAGKPVIGLETRYESTRAIAATSLGSQFKAMLAFVRAMGAPEDEQETSIQIYLSRRLGLYFEWPDSPFDISPDEIRALDEFFYNVLEVRNLTMRDRSLPHIAQGGAFIAVGAAHLPGDKGLVELFRKAGYVVTPVN